MQEDEASNRVSRLPAEKSERVDGEQEHVLDDLVDSLEPAAGPGTQVRSFRGRRFAARHRDALLRRFGVLEQGQKRIVHHGRTMIINRSFKAKLNLGHQNNFLTFADSIFTRQQIRLVNAADGIRN